MKQARVRVINKLVNLSVHLSSKDQKAKVGQG